MKSMAPKAVPSPTTIDSVIIICVSEKWNKYPSRDFSFSFMMENLKMGDIYIKSKLSDWQLFPNICLLRGGKNVKVCIRKYLKN
jgi:hypothetical protein